MREEFQSHNHQGFRRPFRGGGRSHFRRHHSDHYGLAERDAPRPVPVPTNEIPAAYATNVFGKVDPLIQHALAEENYEKPTPIQEQAIPPLLDGRDILGCAQTGTGKTAAFLLPILHKLYTEKKDLPAGHPRALILSPTRELAAQTATCVASYGKFLGLPFAVVFGGVSQYPQVQALERGAVLVVATPGRLLDLMEQGRLDLDAVEEFVLDEADRMLDMGFMPDIKRICARLPKERHTQFFSATLSNEILRIAKSMVKNPVEITITPDQPTVDKINQKVIQVQKPDKDQLLLYLLTNHPEMTKVIVFARTRHGADKIVRRLEQGGVRSAAIHSDKSQRARTDALREFKEGDVRVLVATDIASRGIDVSGITHVVNFDLPEETESYVHRIGRTARAGADGCAISFVAREERGLLKAIERMIRKTIPVEDVPDFHPDPSLRAPARGGDRDRPAWTERRRNEGGFGGGRGGHGGRGGRPSFRRRDDDDGERGGRPAFVRHDDVGPNGKPAFVRHDDGEDRGEQPPFQRDFERRDERPRGGDDREQPPRYADFDERRERHGFGGHGGGFRGGHGGGFHGRGGSSRPPHRQYGEEAPFERDFSGEGNGPFGGERERPPHEHGFRPHKGGPKRDFKHGKVHEGRPQKAVSPFAKFYKKHR